MKSADKRTTATNDVKRRRHKTSSSTSSSTSAILRKSRSPSTNKKVANRKIRRKKNMADGSLVKGDAVQTTVADDVSGNGSSSLDANVAQVRAPPPRSSDGLETNLASLPVVASRDEDEAIVEQVLVMSDDLHATTFNPVLEAPFSPGKRVFKISYPPFCFAEVQLPVFC